jgi:hypothetical protein
MRCASLIGPLFAALIITALHPSRLFARSCQRKAEISGLTKRLALGQVLTFEWICGHSLLRHVLWEYQRKNNWATVERTR